MKNFQVVVNRANEKMPVVFIVTAETQEKANAKVERYEKRNRK